MSISNYPDYDKLMDTVRILDTHYSSVVSKARSAMMDAQFRGDAATANAFRKIIKSMSKEHETALDVIANKLTEPDQLQAVRKALRGAADKAFKFLKKLKKVKMTLDKAAEAAAFITQLVKDVRAVF